MNRKTTKIIICLVVLAAIIGTGIGFYLYNHHNATDHIDLGTPYYLKDIRPTERFAGAEINQTSYFQINRNKRTGTLYLAGLKATTDASTGRTAAVPFIVTRYQNDVKQTTIEFEYIIDAGDKTQIQRLKAVCKKGEIRISTVESHGIQDVITQNPENIKHLDYMVTILVFTKEGA